MDAQNAQIMKAERIDLRRDDRLAAVIQQIIDACLLQVTTNGPLIRTHNPDALHQTRVGVRRARSAMALFKKQIDKASRKRMNEELRGMGNRLGVNRDLDVMLLQTLPRAERQLETELPRIRKEVQKLRDDAYVRAEEESWHLADTTLLLRDDIDEPIDEMAPELLARQARRVKKCLRHLDTPEQRHSLRKAMKKLRYSVEFFESLYDHKAVRHYLQRCKDLQEVLGDMNDASTTIRLTAGMEGLPGQDVLHHWAQQQETKTIEQIDIVIREFRLAKPFWH
jgi:CHAD domain-containing protein